MFSCISWNSRAPQTRHLKNIRELSFANYKLRAHHVYCCYQEETQSAARLRDLTSTCVPYWQPREKGLSKLRLLKLLREFLLSARKLIFSGMHRLCFLSEASGETVTPAFYLFYFLYYCLFFSSWSTYYLILV